MTFDFFRPDTPDIKAFVICIHGGGWISGDKSGMRDVAETLVANGYAAACPSYRLAPLHTFPAAVEDLREFVRYMRRHAEEYKIDPDAIAALGNSAGGHLAAMLGLSDGAENDVSSRVNAAVAICPLTDITSPREQHFPISWAFIEQFMGVPYEEHPERFEQASPVFHVDADAPPMLIIHGEGDDIVPLGQSEALAAALDECDVPYSLHRLPGEGHAFSYEAWIHIEQLFLEFFRNTLGVASASELA